MFHVSLLKQYVHGSVNQSKAVPQPILIGDELEFEVERILRHRKRRGRGHGLEYLIVWKGFDLSEATWEASDNLDNA